MKKTFILYMILLLVLAGGCSPIKKIIMPQEDDGKSVGELTEVKDMAENAKGGEVKDAPDAVLESPQAQAQNAEAVPSPEAVQETPQEQASKAEAVQESPQSQTSNAEGTPSPEAVQESPQAETPNAGPSPEDVSDGENGTAPTPSPKPKKASSSSAAYSVRVDISEQKVYVYQEDEVVRAMVCSTGIEDDAYRTPRGEFIINESGKKKGEWFYEPKFQQGAKYWVGFIGGKFLFHSVPMDKNKNIIESEAEKLGSPASHGCIRLSLEDAYWFYSTIPSGTKLIIED